MGAIDIYDKQQLTAKEVQAQINLIQEVMAHTMKEDVHYGKVPGCGDKPALFKPGAEKILATFRLSANPDIEDLSNPDEIRYRIKSEIQSSNGIVIGYGVGECSSNEDKYKWRKAVCEAEFDETPEDRKREKWKKGYQNAKDYKIKQVRTDVADIANTILKMAKKRSLVDGCLTTTACSDIFEQDIEDLDGVIDIEKKGKKPPVQKTQSRSQAKAGATKSVKVITLVDEITPKEGKKPHKISGEGVTYSTYSDSFAALANTAMESKMKVEITHDGGQYNTIESIELVEDAREERQPGEEG